MPYTFSFKTPELESELRHACEQVVKKFQVPSLRLLCFVDDESPQQFDDICGPFYAGFHIPVVGSGSEWLQHVQNLFFDSMENFACDNVIYINGRTSATLVGTVITLAHELQHFAQFAFHRKVWKTNTLIYDILRTGPTINVKAWDIPFEIDAMRVSKRAADEILGEEVVKEHARAQVAF
jgi:hypothetical protein